MKQQTKTEYVWYSARSNEIKLLTPLWHEVWMYVGYHKKFIVYLGVL